VASSLLEADAQWRGRVAWDLAAALNEFVREGDVVITIGAGDITQTGPELKRHLETRR
jgi:UDP-N-acetylmuramate-alanine ligase